MHKEIKLDVSQIIQARAIFSEQGNYGVTLKLIDRDNSDKVIAEQTFNLSVLETAVTPTTPTPTEAPTNPPATPNNNKTDETSKEVPKTGDNLYISVAISLIALAGVYISLSKKK